jgi:hypothetical protein
VLLVQNVKQHLKLNQVKVLCRLVECLITTIVLQKKGIDFPDEPVVLEHEHDRDAHLSTSFQLTDIPKEMASHWKKQSGFVDDFLGKRLPINLTYCNGTEWDQELQVSTC